MTGTVRELVPAAHLRTVQTGRSVIVVNYLDGTVTLLTGRAHATWLTYVRGATMRSRDPYVHVWLRRGWLAAGRSDATTCTTVQVSDPVSSWGTQEVSVYLPPPAPCPWRWRFAAFPAVLAVVAVKHLGQPTGTFHRLVQACRIGTRLPVASSEQAHRAVRAVRWAARLIPARVACLEESVAAVLLLVAAGKRARWRHGIATDPIRLHAWLVDPDGAAVEEPAETAQYTVITEMP